MLDTPIANPNHRKEPATMPPPGDDNDLRSPDGQDSVEALEEALATARVRLQERLAGEIEAQRRELERLKADYDARSAESNAMMARANETAARVLRESAEAAAKAQQEATEAAEHIRREANEAAEQTRREASEAADHLQREATQAAARTLSEAREAARILLTRLRDGADVFCTMAATEIETMETLTSDGPKSEVQTAARERTPGKPAEKEGPSRWLRSPLKGRGAGASSAADTENSSPSASPDGDGAGEIVSAASEPPAQAIVTRLIVHPLVGANTRSRIQDRLEEIAGVQAVKLGPTGDESFELLIIHSREARVPDSVLAVAPDEIVLRDQKAGYLEIELKNLDWVEQAAEAASRSA